MKMDVGIVVIGRNEGERLIRCLESVREVPALSNRTVYVDSGSNDGSPDVALRMGALAVPLSADRPFNAARARNEGFEALRRLIPDLKYVLFVDGDCTLNPTWVPKSLELMEARNDVAVVCGRRRERNPVQSVYNELCDMEWDTAQGEVASCGGDFLIRAAAFEEISGFNSDLVAGEEPEMCARLRERKWAILRVPVEMTTHDAAILRFRQWWHRTARSGYGNTQVAWIHRRSRSCIEKRSVISAVFWGGILPSAICLGSVIDPLALAAASLYPVQICRIAIGRGLTEKKSWVYAVFMLIAKLAELNGVIAFVVSSVHRILPHTFEYKRA
jgi:glycosyltransferase involved in cell wall biosynthesis